MSGISKEDRRIIEGWPLSEITVCAKCGEPARTSEDHQHPQWACLPCDTVVYSMTPAFCRGSDFAENFR
jgi:hypothetical protein